MPRNELHNPFPKMVKRVNGIKGKGLENSQQICLRSWKRESRFSVKSPDNGSYKRRQITAHITERESTGNKTKTVQESCEMGKKPKLKQPPKLLCRFAMFPFSLTSQTLKKFDLT